MEFIYYPLFPVWLFFALKARSFFFFNAANPSITNGGMAMESKKDIYDLIPQRYIPKTVFVKKNDSTTSVLKKLPQAGINFPVIAKPDIGMKAFGVAKLNTEEELWEYANITSTNYLIQEFIPYPKEVGIFYIRLPHEETGRITGMVSKEFLSVTGDGERTILELIKQKPRSYFQLSELNRLHGRKLQQVLKKGEKYVLVPFGSHTRGAKFTDCTGQKNNKLVQSIDTICKQVPGFYYGRLDILYTTLEELTEGKNFRIIEINGAGSEATHIYDPRHSLFFAWREIIRHWNFLYKISIINRSKGHPYLSFKDGTAMLRANSQLETQLKHTFV